MFVNRREAGVQLAQMVDQYLTDYLGLAVKSNVMVVGLPRGGVPVALEVARRLGCSLEVVVAKKLPYPGQPELAIGAVSSDGVVVLSPDIPNDSQWRAYVEEQRRSLLQKLMAVEQQFYNLAERTRAEFKGRVVILVDDGIATGMTAMAAAETVKLRGAASTIIATPVMSRDSYQQLRSHCDHVLAISVPDEFNAVGQHYINFEQTSNDEVVLALRESVTFARPAYQLSQESAINSVSN
jgi:predicted phosphoribosyltransferase